VSAAGGFRPRVRYLATSEAAVDEMALRAGAFALGTATSAARSDLRLRPLDHRFTRRMLISWNTVTVPDPLVDRITGRIRRWYGRTQTLRRKSA
jgi:hypothetical protein